MMAKDPREEMRRIQRTASKICVHILRSDYPLIDIDLERDALREECSRLFPDRLWLFDMIYESRFDRLISQWRPETSDD